MATRVLHELEWATIFSLLAQPNLWISAGLGSFGCTKCARIPKTRSLRRRAERDPIEVGDSAHVQKLRSLMGCNETSMDIFCDPIRVATFGHAWRAGILRGMQLSSAYMHLRGVWGCEVCADRRG